MNEFKKKHSSISWWVVSLFLLMPIKIALADCDYQSIDWSKVTVVSDDLYHFRFHPNELDFETCKPYELKISNTSGRIGHSFTAPDFFKSIKLRNPDTGDMSTPSYEELMLAPQSEIDIQFVPAMAGGYPLWCSHKFHTSLGMKGWIYVYDQQKPQ